MYPRTATASLISAASEFPVVTVVGPRQSGKTTLVKTIFAEKPYVSLEDPDVRRVATSDPRAFLAEYPQGAVLDEIQQVPELLSYLQTDVDQNSEMGRWILTGSHQTTLRQGVTQSLAGRTALIHLLPLSVAELQGAEDDVHVPDIILRGFYPALHERSMQTKRFYRAYYQTYVERDVRQLIQLRDLVAFDNFMRLLAGHVGQLVNYNQLATQVGVSAPTIREWMSVLEASYVIYRLPPYFENFNKRVTKSPRLYFTDVGLAAWLLGIETVAQLKRDPAYGRLYENLVVIELLKRRYNQEEDPELYFFRDAHQNEVDLILRRGRLLIPIEIKAATTPQEKMIRGLDRFADLAGDRVTNCYVIYNGKTHQLGTTKFIHFLELPQL